MGNKKEIISVNVDYIVASKAKNKAKLLGTNIHYILLLFLIRFTEDDSIIALSSKYKDIQ